MWEAAGIHPSFGVAGVGLVFGDVGDVVLPVDALDVGAAAHEHAVHRHRKFVDFGGVAADDEVDLVLGGEVEVFEAVDLVGGPAVEVGLVGEGRDDVALGADGVGGAEAGAGLRHVFGPDAAAGVAAAPDELAGADVGVLQGDLVVLRRHVPRLQIDILSCD